MCYANPIRGANMPSPFPGLDPFLESQLWDDFHTQFVTIIREMLVPRVRPQYLVNVERYVYMTQPDDEDEVVKIIAPDVFVSDTGHGWREYAGRAVATLAPVRNRLPMPKRRRAYLTIRTKEFREVVTVIELLSPSNKARGDGVAEYLGKRANVQSSTTNLVELDFLRGGQRLPTANPLQPGDYFAFVSRPTEGPDIDVYGWSLRDPLPSIPIPLAEPDPDVLLDLQDVFTTTYDRAGYDYALNYRAPVRPPLSADDAAWVTECLASLTANAESKLE